MSKKQILELENKFSNLIEIVTGGSRWDTLKKAIMAFKKPFYC